jgi:ribosomal-protein-alanine N-acetyltransferase
MIETPRLILRKFRADDLDELCLLYADPEVRRFFPEGTLNRAQTREELDWHLNGDFPGHPGLGLWATTHRPTGRFIWRCGFIHWVIEDQSEIEIAYLLAREFWGQGLGAEVAGALVQHGLTRLALPRLIALIDPGNIASILTAESAGLRFEREVDFDGEKAQLYSIEPSVA